MALVCSTFGLLSEIWMRRTNCMPEEHQTKGGFLVGGSSVQHEKGVQQKNLDYDVFTSEDMRDIASTLARVIHPEAHGY